MGLRWVLGGIKGEEAAVGVYCMREEEKKKKKPDEWILHSLTTN